MIDLWYKNAVIYCVDVDSFLDANGDGIGDFPGLIRRLDYLAGMGVTCIWLLPFQPSPNRDNGYDISDYYGVDPKLGDVGDFVDFTREARGRGIRVVMDLVVNHTSDQHPWFQQARRDPKSKYRDYYVWSDTRPKDARKGMVFPGVQKTTWTRDPVARAWYFHRFYRFQPDLNTENPAVKDEIRKIMGYWLELGVSGFRVDAMPFVISEKGARSQHRERYGYLREMREFCQWRIGDSMLLAEANVVPTLDADYFGDGDRVHMMFNFEVNQHLFLSLATEDARPLAKALTETAKMPPTAQWAQFLRNNDELDLGRLTPGEQAKVFAAFAPEKRMQLYDRGIRRRLAPMLNGDRRRLELAYSLLFALPGTPVLRYGDEIGMGEDLSLEERSAARTPMQWSAEKNGGFSLADKTVLPPIATGAFGYPSVNVADQRRHPGSLLNWTERMIRMRKQCPEVGWGQFQVLRPGVEAVLALRYEWRGNAMVLLHNLGASPATVRLDLGNDRGQVLTHLLDDRHVRPTEEGRHQIELEGFGYRWYRVGGLTDILLRGVEGSAPDGSRDTSGRLGPTTAPTPRRRRRTQRR